MLFVKFKDTKIENGNCKIEKVKVELRDESDSAFINFNPDSYRDSIFNSLKEFNQSWVIIIGNKE